MADKDKKGISFKERVLSSMGTNYGNKKAQEILKKDKEKGNDPNRIVAYPPERGPGLPRQGVSTVPKIKKEQKNKKNKEPNLVSPVKLVKKGPALGDTPKKSTAKGQVEKGADPLKDKPRSIAAARKAGEKYFYDKKGEKKLAVTGAELKKKGMTLKEWANTFAKRKQTKKDATILKPYAKDKKLKKNPANKKAGGMMKKKGYAGGGKLKMVEKDGQKVPFYAADGKGRMRGGGMMMKKKGYAKGGAMKKKSYKKGGKVLKMRGGGLATKGTNFKIR